MQKKTTLLKIKFSLGRGGGQEKEELVGILVEDSGMPNKERLIVLIVVAYTAFFAPFFKLAMG